MRNDYQLSVLLIEHDMPFVNKLCERVMVLEYGKPLFSGLMSRSHSGSGRDFRLPGGTFYA